jgi:gas vesicle protein GvpL/GvpF
VIAGAERTAPDDAPVETAAYVYGVVRSGVLRGVKAEGIAGEPVDIVDGDGVAALVSDVPASDLRVRRADLRRHLDVIEEAFGKATILPCRFGTLVDSRAAVRAELLEPRRDELLQGLEQLDERVQLNVKATYDEEALLGSIVAQDREIAALRDRTRELGAAGHAEQIRLGELVAAAVEDRRAFDAARLVEQLAASAADVVVEEASGGTTLKASFLVDRKRLRSFDKTLERVAAAEQSMLQFEVIGPLPPTAFAAAVAEM